MVDAVIVIVSALFLGFILGFILGAIVVVVLSRVQSRQNEAQFAALSMDALQKASEQFLKLANETLSRQTELGSKDLEGKKELIDQTLGSMKDELQKVNDLVTGLEKDREHKYGELSEQLKHTAEQTGRLQETTSQLHQALAHTQTRGQWGERMAEDVLRMAGFIEGINYLKQRASSVTRSRPDYTFLLPKGLKLNMDVKFPLDNYLRYVEAENEAEKKQYQTRFLRDVRSRIKEVTSREYINRADNTVDYVIVFIPNEQIFAFITETDDDLCDEALCNKVVLCSPLTLFAVLAVIRQAVDNFYLEERAHQILLLLSDFKKQWDMFVNSFETLGSRLDSARKEYEKLASTRRNQLEKQLSKIEDLRQQDQALEFLENGEAGIPPEPSSDEVLYEIPGTESE